PSSALRGPCSHPTNPCVTFPATLPGPDTGSARGTVVSLRSSLSAWCFLALAWSSGCAARDWSAHELQAPGLFPCTVARRSSGRGRHPHLPRRRVRLHPAEQRLGVARSEFAAARLGQDARLREEPAGGPFHLASPVADAARRAQLALLRGLRKGHAERRQTDQDGG